MDVMPRFLRRILKNGCAQPNRRVGRPRSSIIGDCCTTGPIRRTRRSQQRADAKIYLLRYEDLSEDFVATMQPLLQWLGLADSKPLLESIQAKTSFEALTGRARGTEAKAVMRKGAVGEWREALLPDEQERAWRLAGDQLRAFGYTRHGTRRGLPDLSKIEEQPYRFQRTLELEEQVAALRTVVCRLEADLWKKTQ